MGIYAHLCVGLSVYRSAHVTVERVLFRDLGFSGVEAVGAAYVRGAAYVVGAAIGAANVVGAA